MYNRCGTVLNFPLNGSRQDTNGRQLGSRERGTILDCHKRLLIGRMACWRAAKMQGDGSIDCHDCGRWC